jgi:hypothetical protein
MQGGTLMGGPGAGGGANPYMHPQHQPAPHSMFSQQQQHQQVGVQSGAMSGGDGHLVKQEPEGTSNMDDILNMFLKDD